jgi:hypothetical protein
MTAWTREDWRALEAEVAEQVTAQLIEAEATPLQPGQLIAWTETGHMGTTEKLGPVHSVETWTLDRATTTCGAIIPPPKRWIPLSAGIVRSLGRCPFCVATRANTQPRMVNPGVAA